MRNSPDEKRADLALWQENGKRLQAILDAAPALMFVVDDENRFVFVNRAWERTFGLSRQQVAGRSLFELIPEPEAGVLAAQNRRLFETGTPIESETTMHVEGAERTFITTKVALLQDNERPATVCGLSVDITERKRSEKRLRLLSEVASALVVHGEDVDGFMDEMCRKLAAELQGDVHFHFRPQGSPPRLRLASCGGLAPEVAQSLEWLDYGVEVCGTVAATRQPWAIADVQASEDERTRLIRELGVAACACFPLLYNDTLYGTLFLGRRSGGAFGEQDFELMQTVADLVAVAFDRAARSRELAEVDRHRKEFLAVLAHELRGPIGPILTAAAVQQRAPDDAALVEQARDVIQRQASNLLRLADELLDGARVSHGKITLEAGAVELAAAIGEGIEISRPEIEARGHALAVSLPREPVEVSGDRRRLAQVFANLLANSARYTPPGGHISLSAVVEDAAVAISVRDDGIGIEADELPRVFNLFEQASAPRRAGGLGLGLSLVKSLVELHGGSIEARSAGRGKGSEFTVRLPRLERQLRG